MPPLPPLPMTASTGTSVHDPSHPVQRCARGAAPLVYRRAEDRTSSKFAIPFESGAEPGGECGRNHWRGPLHGADGPGRDGAHRRCRRTGAHGPGYRAEEAAFGLLESLRHGLAATSPTSAPTKPLILRVPPSAAHRHVGGPAGAPTAAEPPTPTPADQVNRRPRTRGVRLVEIRTRQCGRQRASPTLPSMVRQHRGEVHLRPIPRFPR